MKVLLDECLPLNFRHSFHDYEAHTAEWAGFKGKKNGELLRDAELAGTTFWSRSTKVLFISRT